MKHARHSKRLKMLSAIVLTLSLVPFVLFACTTVPTPKSTAAPTLAARTQPSPTRPPLLIQYCDDTTGSYPHGYFGLANRTIADSLKQAVTANQQGVTLYATAITHNTFDPVNTLNPAFSIPAVDAYPAPPTPAPTHAPDNPVFDNATKTAVASDTLHGILTYNQRVATIDQTLKSAKDAIGKDVRRLTSWNVPVDQIATSVLGCFQLAASRFTGQPGAKMIYISSDLENNTDIDRTQDFVKKKALEGAIVHVIYFYSQNAARDQEKRAQWCPYLKSAGASVVIFSDPAVPLHDIFDNDLKLPETTC